ncbi:hypothetical protein AUQ39_00315 [Lacticaseibacillus casei]|nr:hypothetical protein AAW28_00740 [Lacticaseibacillus casei]OLS11616.1 hypothetical protein AUQ39_00315 [Lacticaseibacillus casei]
MQKRRKQVMTYNNLVASLVMSCDGIEESVGYDPWLFAILELEHTRTQVPSHERT